MDAKRLLGHPITWMLSIGNWTSLGSEGDVDVQVFRLGCGIMYQQPTILEHVIVFKPNKNTKQQVENSFEILEHKQTRLVAWCSYWV